MSESDPLYVSSMPITDRHLTIIDDYFSSFSDLRNIDSAECTNAASRVAEWRSPFGVLMNGVSESLDWAQKNYETAPPEGDVLSLTLLGGARMRAWETGMRVFLLSGELTESTKEYVSDNADLFNVTSKQLYRAARPTPPDFQALNIAFGKRKPIRAIGREAVRRLELVGPFRLRMMQLDDIARGN